jgi:hypothetical protein
MRSPAHPVCWLRRSARLDRAHQFCHACTGGASLTDRGRLRGSGWSRRRWRFSSSSPNYARLNATSEVRRPCCRSPERDPGYGQALEARNPR